MPTFSSRALRLNGQTIQVNCGEFNRVPPSQKNSEDLPDSPRFTQPLADPWLLPGSEPPAIAPGCEVCNANTNGNYAVTCHGFKLINLKII